MARRAARGKWRRPHYRAARYNHAMIPRDLTFVLGGARSG
ncbi:bifunctional adenosylcobinamide kinase/adenosylcobinamide-phosphate guanylyltransferase, partial [Burkholderia pseudomallei]